MAPDTTDTTPLPKPMDPIERHNLRVRMMRPTLANPMYHELNALPAGRVLPVTRRIINERTPGLWTRKPPSN